MTVRTDEEPDVIATGVADERFSVLDLKDSTKFFIGGVPPQSGVTPLSPKRS